MQIMLKVCVRNRPLNPHGESLSPAGFLRLQFGILHPEMALVTSLLLLAICSSSLGLSVKLHGRETAGSSSGGSCRGACSSSSGKRSSSRSSGKDLSGKANSEDGSAVSNGYPTPAKNGSIRTSPRTRNGADQDGCVVS